jgi:hypothetical protein
MPDSNPNPNPNPNPAPVAITSESLGAVQGDAFRALLPADIQAKPYAKEINNFGDLLKKHDGAVSLLGQRAVPDVAADVATWKGYHDKSAPKTPGEYKLPEAIEGVPPEYVKKAVESKYMRPLLHAAGASQYQAQVLVSGLMKMLYTAEQGDKTAKDAAFTKLSTELFGDKKDEISANAKKFLASHIPENMQPLLAELDEKQFAILLAVTDGMAKKFTGEDPFRGGGGGGGGGGGETKDVLIGQMQTIQKDPCYTDPFKDRPKHAELLAKMDVIRGKLKKLQGGA